MLSDFYLTQLVNWKPYQRSCGVVYSPCTQEHEDASK